MTSLNSQQIKKLSKEVARALRHVPWVYELELDDEGWVPTADLIDGLMSRKRWSGLSSTDLQYMVDHQTKRRYEIDGDRIRAFYGHSISRRIAKTPAEPPPILYHGTAPQTVPLIMQDGLRPMRRQYVHLSVDLETADQVGNRKANKPVILSILAQEAANAGHKFYIGHEMVWLADYIPAEFVRLPNSG